MNDVTREKLTAYAALLLEANKTMNLIGPSTEDDVFSRHFADSLAPLDLGIVPRGTLIDVGTGAGFPGMVLAIACPDLRVTLLDSLGKRTAFLSRVADELALPNVEVLTGRAEELAHTPRRETFDFATARAVTAMSALCELCLPLLKVGGRLLAYKTARAAEEIAAASSAARKLGGRLLDPLDYQLGEATMRLQQVEKLSPTPPNYPRQWGQIKNKPL